MFRVASPPYGIGPYITSYGRGESRRQNIAGYTSDTLPKFLIRKSGNVGGLRGGILRIITLGVIPLVLGIQVWADTKR